MAFSKEPPGGSFPPTSLAGARFFQKREWLICPTAWFHTHYPEKQSTTLTTTIELQGILERNFLCCGVGGRITLFSRVQSVNICLMVLGMVKCHNFFRNIWFKGLLDENIIKNSGKNKSLTNR
jgi:hypothetical protein